MVLLISSYLLLVFMVPVVLSLIVSYRALPRGRVCAHCAQETVALRGKLARVQAPALWLLRLERRWCLQCGWAGLVRRGESEVRIQPLFPNGLLNALPRSVQSLDVRTLRLDGRNWRVQLQCWREAEQVFGRLVFIDPGGRSWADGAQGFAAGTQFEVLGQALSIPDRTLASRVRQLMIAE